MARASYAAINRLTNEQLIEVCQKAKACFLWDGKSSSCLLEKTIFVCFALGKAMESLYGRCEKGQKLTKLVKAHIGSHVFLTDFLQEKFGYTKVQSLTSRQVQAWRFLMLDNMIKMLQEEGAQA